MPPTITIDLETDDEAAAVKRTREAYRAKRKEQADRSKYREAARSAATAAAYRLYSNYHDRPRYGPVELFKRGQDVFADIVRLDTDPERLEKTYTISGTDGPATVSVIGTIEAVMTDGAGYPIGVIIKDIEAGRPDIVYAIGTAGPAVYFLDLPGITAAEFVSRCCSEETP